MSIAACAPGSEHPGRQACPEPDDLHAATAARERDCDRVRFGDRRLVWGRQLAALAMRWAYWDPARTAWPTVIPGMCAYRYTRSGA